MPEGNNSKAIEIQFILAASETRVRQANANANGKLTAPLLARYSAPCDSLPIDFSRAQAFPLLVAASLALLGPPDARRSAIRNAFAGKSGCAWEPGGLCLQMQKCQRPHRQSLMESSLPLFCKTRSRQPRVAPRHFLTQQHIEKSLWEEPTALFSAIPLPRSQKPLLPCLQGLNAHRPATRISTNSDILALFGRCPSARSSSSNAAWPSR